MLKFISKWLTKFVEDNGYVKADNIVTKEQLSKIRNDFQAGLQNIGEEIKKQSKKYQMNERETQTLKASVEHLGARVDEAYRHASVSAEQAAKSLQQDLIALRKTDKQMAKSIKQLNIETVNIDSIRTEFDKKIAILKETAEKATKIASDSLENTKAFKGLYDSVIANTKRKHRKFETVMPSDQTDPNDDNKS